MNRRKNAYTVPVCITHATRDAVSAESRHIVYRTLQTIITLQSIFLSIQRYRKNSEIKLPVKFKTIKMGIKGLETFIRENSNENIAHDVNIRDAIVEWQR